jgi:tRNA-2-methylthio-N6-dimethylallyladenosine synthase
MKKIFIQTFGCQMNVSETDRMFSMLALKGYVPTDSQEEADLILLNTCSVRARAENKVYGHLDSLKPLKRRKPSLLIGVGGCVAQQEGERILERAPQVDLVFGTHNLHLLPEMVAAAEKGKRRSAVEFLDNDTRISLYPTADPTGSVTAFVTIMQGCDNFCAYCIVPHVRGREVSRPAADILSEVRAHAARGTQEVTLLGQNVNSYGKNLTQRIDFAALLRQVADVPGITRVRFTTSHPRDVSPELVRCFADIPSLCGHIHLPAQCGSDRILSLMGRGYSRAEYLETVRAIRRARTDILITGDMIVGFPGETEGEFEETLALMEEVRYADLFSFIYSTRPGTAAAGMKEQVPYAVKQKRLARLQEIQMATTRQLHDGMVGSRQMVLLEGKSRRPGQVFGRTDGNRIVNLEAPAELVGTMVDVQITKAHQTSLGGCLVVESSGVGHQRGA